ncbi:tetratricopeptide repeat protein [Bacteroidota bacterium]
MEKYDEIKDMDDSNYFFDERELNQLGYSLMGNSKLKEAIEIFEINVDKNPNSANVYDSLGEAYMNAGFNKEAIEAYEKSLELNPDNSNAEDQLKKIKM